MGVCYYFLVGGQLLWMAFCFTCLFVQTRLIWDYVQSKPLIYFRLTDQVTSDLAVLYFVNFSIHIIMNATAILDITIPSVPAFVLSQIADVCGASFAIYISAGICIQFAHIKLQVVNIFENITEESVSSVMRLVTFGFSNLICGAKILYGSHSIFYSMMTKTEERKPYVGAAMVAILGLISLIVNVTLRIVIYMEKKKYHRIQRDWQAKADIPFGAYISFALVLLLLIVAVVVARLTGTKGAYITTRHVLLGLFCTALPCCLIYKNDKMKMYAQRTLLDFAKDRYPSLEKLLSSSQIQPEGAAP